MIVIGLFFLILEHVLEMTTIQLRAFLEAQHKVVKDILTNRPRNGSYLLPDGFLQFSDGSGSPCIHSVLQVAPKEEIWVAKVWAVRCPLKISLETDHTVSKVLFQPVSGKLGGVRACSILLEPELSHK